MKLNVIVELLIAEIGATINELAKIVNVIVLSVKEKCNIGYG